jgi:hypothetical protein
VKRISAVAQVPNNKSLQRTGISVLSSTIVSDAVVSRGRRSATLIGRHLLKDSHDEGLVSMCHTLLRSPFIRAATYTDFVHKKQ